MSVGSEIKRIKNARDKIRNKVIEMGLRSNINPSRIINITPGSVSFTSCDIITDGGIKYFSIRSNDEIYLYGDPGVTHTIRIKFKSTDINYEYPLIAHSSTHQEDINMVVKQSILLDPNSTEYQYFKVYAWLDDTNPNLYLELINNNYESVIIDELAIVYSADIDVDSTIDDCASGIADDIYVVDNFTITPSTEKKVFNNDGKCFFKSITINPIPNTYMLISDHEAAMASLQAEIAALKE